MQGADMNQQEAKLLYTAKAHTTGGRDGGASRTDDGRLDLKFSTPGTAGTGTNPEQLFAAGWSACFVSALEIAAHRMKVSLAGGLADDAEVDLLTTGAAYFIRARHNISMPGVAPETARALIDTAETLCPYSIATRGNIEVAYNLV
jgi:osmotically inducible protein OsmC